MIYLSKNAAIELIIATNTTNRNSLTKFETKSTNLQDFL